MKSIRVNNFFSDRDVFIGITLSIVLLWHFTNSFFNTGYITASILTFTIIGLDAVFILKNKDELLAKLFLISFFAGWSELFADAWLVNDIQKLVYDSNGPFVFSSPLYMPFAWTAILFQFSYLTHKSMKTRSFNMVLIQSAVFGGLLIPLYEHFAFGAGWWFYQNTPMFGKAPYFIILGEMMILFSMPFLIKMVEKRSIYSSFPIGIVIGCIIWGSYWISYQITG